MHDTERQQVAAWLEPLPDDAAPCGADLESQIEFLELSKAAAGKPETSFGPGEPPDWRSVVELSSALLDRSRDLRIALMWLRGHLHQSGYGMLPVGLKLITGLMAGQWDHVHPLPDPDDGDPYARVNLLSELRDNAVLLADLRESRLVQDRAAGIVTVREALVALGQLRAGEDEASRSREQLESLLADVGARTPDLKPACEEAVIEAKRLIDEAGQRLGDAAPDLRPLHALCKAIDGLVPAAEADAGTEASGDGTEGTDPPHGEATGTGGGASGAKRLSGTIQSREDALRAIDLVCAYLERAEPANPAALFLRRGQQLIGQNFLQLLRALAPDALPGVAGMVGVDPASLDPSAGDGSSDDSSY